jgi:hypothetical protein
MFAATVDAYVGRHLASTPMLAGTCLQDLASTPMLAGTSRRRLCSPRRSTPMLAGTSHRRLCWPVPRGDAYVRRDGRRLCCGTLALAGRVPGSARRPRRRCARPARALATAGREWRRAPRAAAAPRTAPALCGLVPWHLLPGECNGLTPARAILVCAGDLGAASLLAVSAAGRAPLAGWRGLPKAGEMCAGAREAVSSISLAGGLSIAARPPPEWRRPLCRSRASVLPCDFELRLATWRRICAVRSARHPRSVGGSRTDASASGGLGTDRGHLNESGYPFAYRGGRSRLGAAVVTASGSRRRAEIGRRPRRKTRPARP